MTSNAAGPVSAGQQFTYTLTVTNNGPTFAANIQVTDNLPAEVTHVSNTCGVAFAGNPFTWDVGGLAVGASAACDITVEVVSSAPGLFTNTANVTSHAGVADPVPANNTDSTDITVQADADLEVVKTVDAVGAIPGDTIVYHLTVTNYGPADATGGVVVDDLPAALTYQSNSCGAPAPVGTLFTWTVGNLANGASASCDLSVILNASGSIDNLAEVSADQPDPVLANNLSMARFAAVPSLSTWGLLAFAVLLGFAALWMRRRRVV